ncbi:MAG: aspartate kinase [Chitinivibrionales bacterium]|nr:aspartate kinase [Chitinivibrionales bacterium]
MDFVVSKFGGSSVATADMLRRVAAILDGDSRRRCVVVSAPGKSPSHNTKVTDMLIGLTEASLRGADTAEKREQVRQRFHQIYGELGLSAELVDSVLADLDERIALPKDDRLRYRDAIVASGECFNARLFAEFLAASGKPARFVSPEEAGLVVTDRFGDAQPTDDACQRLASLKDICADTIVVFPGFYGVTKSGDIATFSRGGSDLTGAILAEALDAAEYENWTDVDGIFSANPLDVEAPEQVPALTYREMRELSYIGFNVLHEEAVRPVLDKKIPIRLRNTANLDNPGTLIVSERLPSERDVVGIASGGRYCSINVQKFLMNREIGFVRRVLSIIEQAGLSIEHIPSGVDSISVVVDQRQLKPETINNIIKAIERQLEPDEVKVEFGISLVAVVGEGLIHKVGVLAQVATALAHAGVNIKMADQGSSEISIIFGIDASDERRAVGALYTEFFPVTSSRQS